MTGRYRIKLGDHTASMHIMDGDTLRVLLDKKDLSIDVCTLGTSRWSLLVGNRSIVVSASERNGKLELLVDGVPAVCEVGSEYAYSLKEFVGDRGNSEAMSGAVLAPISGKIVKVVVKVGDSVSVGDPLCVLEAMKMENELKSEVAGTVREIFVSAGGTVGTDDKLLEIA